MNTQHHPKAGESIHFTGQYLLAFTDGTRINVQPGDSALVTFQHVFSPQGEGIVAEQALATDRNDHIRKIVKVNSERRADNDRLRSLLATERAAIDELEATVATWRKRLTDEEEENAKLRHSMECLSKHHRDAFSILEKAGISQTETLSMAIARLVKERDDARSGAPSNQDWASRVTKAEKERDQVVGVLKDIREELGVNEAHDPFLTIRQLRAEHEEAAKLSHQYRNERDAVMTQRAELQGDMNEIKRVLVAAGVDAFDTCENGATTCLTTLDMVEEFIGERNGLLRNASKLRNERDVLETENTATALREREKDRIILHDVTELHATLREILTKAGVVYEGGIKNHVAILANKKLELEKERDALKGELAREKCRDHAAQMDRIGHEPERNASPLLKAFPPPVVDWAKMPAWANFLAMQEGGSWYWFHLKPTCLPTYWAMASNEADEIPAEFWPKFSGNWRESLVQRPAA